MKKAIFLDRDGTINVEKNYLYKIEEFEFLPGVIEGLRRFKEAGYLLVVLTNQSGIGRGYYTKEEYQCLEDWMLNQLRQAGAEIDGIYHCPHLPDAQVEDYRKDCVCRKPKLGMFRKAILEHDILETESIAIGDKKRDLAICREKKVQGFLVYADSDYIEESSNIHYVSGGIADVANYLLGKA